MCGVEGVEAVLWPAALAGTALSADRPPVQDDEVADGDRIHAVANLFHHACGLVAEQERELVVDAALAVGQIGVADTAGLDRHDDLARPGVRDCDRRDLDRRTLGAGDHTSNMLWHR